MKINLWIEIEKPENGEKNDSKEIYWTDTIV